MLYLSTQNSQNEFENFEKFRIMNALRVIPPLRLGASAQRIYPLK